MYTGGGRVYLQREGVALNTTAMLDGGTRHRFKSTVARPAGHPKTGLGKTPLLTGRSRGPPRTSLSSSRNQTPRQWQMLYSRIDRTTRIPEARHIRRGTPGPGMNEPVSDREHQHSTIPSLTDLSTPRYARAGRGGPSAPHRLQTAMYGILDDPPVNHSRAPCGSNPSGRTQPSGQPGRLWYMVGSTVDGCGTLKQHRRTTEGRHPRKHRKTARYGTRLQSWSPPEWCPHTPTHPPIHLP